MSDRDVQREPRSFNREVEEIKRKTMQLFPTLSNLSDQNSSPRSWACHRTFLSHPPKGGSISVPKTTTKKAPLLIKDPGL
jgi:hypothetical protein